MYFYVIVYSAGILVLSVLANLSFTLEFRVTSRVSANRTKTRVKCDSTFSSCRTSKDRSFLSQNRVLTTSPMLCSGGKKTVFFNEKFSHIHCFARHVRWLREALIIVQTHLGFDKICGILHYATSNRRWD